MRGTIRRLTPAGPGGVAVLELAGPGVLRALASLLGRSVPAPGALALVRLPARALGAAGAASACGPGAADVVDAALLVAHGPDAAELHLHGSPPLVAAALAGLGDALGLAAREPGEADEPRDAVASGEPGALEARALALLARAPSEAAARILLDQAEGALRRVVRALEDAAPAARAEGLARLDERSQRLRLALEPPLVALRGPVNAGKSTLFNALVGRARVVVSARPGTTRDAVRETVQLGAYAVELVDTAGERAAGEELERAGQEAGRRASQGADLVLWLDPHGREPEPHATGGARWLVLTSRADRLAPDARARSPRPIAARDDPAGARAAVVAALHEALELPSEPWRPGRAVAFDGASRAWVAACAARARRSAGGE